MSEKRVDFPIFEAKSRSLHKAVLSSAGGAIGKNSDNTVKVDVLEVVIELPNHPLTLIAGNGYCEGDVVIAHTS